MLIIYYNSSLLIVGFSKDVNDQEMQKARPMKLAPL